MKKINKKILLLGVFTPTLIISSSILASCSATTNKKDKGFNTKPFIDNANKKFIDVNSGMNTVDLVKKILTSSEGMRNISTKLGDELIFNWFKNIKTSSIKTYFDDQIKESKKVLSDKKKTYKNMDAFQVNVLDPTGVTEESYIQSNTIENLKSKLIDYLTSKDYLAIVDASNNVFPINNNSPITKNKINDQSNVNATKAGQRNNFKFVGNADSNATDLDYGYANFISFVFDKWVEDNIPVLTPSVLFKTDAKPKESLLFNQEYFGSALTDDASYKFQFFNPINQDFQNPNASMLYQTFIQNKDSYIDNNLKGAINIPNEVTQDSSTKLMSLMATSFDTFVAPYASAVMYKFGNFAFSQIDNNVPTSNSFVNDSIMNNFIVKDQNNLNKAGVFKFPYILSNQNPFSGDYSGMLGIKDVVDIKNDSTPTPWIIIRNQFGVHIIGIDRFNAIQDAGNGKSFVEAKKAVLNELKNTILWRAAQDKSYAAGNNIELQKTIKDYLTSNLPSLFLEYAITSTTTGNDNLFTGSWMSESFNLNNIIPETYKNLVTQSKIIGDFNKLFTTQSTLKNKIYSLQDEYIGVRDSSQWKNFGIAGALPYTRNSTTGNFDIFDKITNILFNKTNNLTNITNEQVLTDYENAKTQYLTTLDEFMKLVQPAGSEFFSKYPKVGVSQTVISNIPFVNKILIDAKSTQTINDIFYDEKYKEYLGSIWNFDSYSFQNSSGSQAKPTNISESTTNFTELNTWIFQELQKAYSSEYVRLNFTKGLANSLYYYGDWSDLSTLSTLATKLDRESISKNRFNKNKQDFLLKWEDNYSINSFIKTIAWLLTWDNELKTFTFKNLMDILDDSISASKVGYVGWMNSSNQFANTLATRPYGLKGTNEPTAILNQMKEDVKFYKYPYYLTKLNPYSYIGAPNLTSTIDNGAGGTSNIKNTYFGDNDNYYSIASISNEVQNATGFMGFQSLNSSILSNSLPSDLYSGKLLSQNTSNPDVNFKGTFYEYNEANDDATKLNAPKPRENLVKFVNDNSSVYELGNLASRMIDIGFNFSDEQLKDLEGVKYGVSYTGESLTLIQRKEILVKIINNTTVIPDVAFEPLRGDYLWNNKSSLGGISTTIFTDDSKKGYQQQYIVSQFNHYDINNLVFFNESQKSFLNPNKLLGLSDDAFFKALIKLALNGEVQNRSNNSWTEQLNKTKYVFYDRSLAKLFGETIVKNWKDFSN